MTGKMTVDLKDVPLYKIPIFTKGPGRSLRGAFSGIKKTHDGGVEIYVLVTESSCEGRMGHPGEPTVARSGSFVGFTLSERARVAFNKAEVKEGDDIELVVHARLDMGHGRHSWDESLVKVVGTNTSHPLPLSQVYGWPDIVDSAKVAYSATEDFRGRMLLLAGRLIDFEASRGLVVLVEEARAAKKARDDEQVERGYSAIGHDGESNETRWRRAAEALAKAMLGGVG